MGNFQFKRYNLFDSPAHAGLNRIGKAVFVIPPLCSQKHSPKGKTSSLKKISRLRYASACIFFGCPCGYRFHTHSCAPVGARHGVLACFVHHVLSFLSHGCTCPLKPHYGIRYAHIFVCRGQPPFRVLLACGRSCCYGLSHFLLLTFPCWHSRVHSVISFILFLSIPSFTPLSPTARKSCLSFSHSVPFRSISLSGAMFFPPCISMWLQHCSV